MRNVSIALMIVSLLIQGAAFGAGESAPISSSPVVDRIAREIVQDTRANALELESAAADLQKNTSWRKKHPTAFGTVVGMSIGMGVGFLMAAGGDDTNAAWAAILLGTAGAGIGALVGSFIPPQ